MVASKRWSPICDALTGFRRIHSSSQRLESVSNFASACSADAAGAAAPSAGAVGAWPWQAASVAESRAAASRLWRMGSGRRGGGAEHTVPRASPHGPARLRLTLGETSMRTVLAVVVLSLACFALPARAACPPEGNTREQLEALKVLKWTVPDAAERQVLAEGLVDCLGDADPKLRDGIAYEALAHW